MRETSPPRRPPLRGPPTRAPAHRSVGTTTGYGSSFGAQLVFGNSTLVPLSGLTPGTAYNYAVISTDSAGTATSTNFTLFHSAAVPVISAVGYRRRNDHIGYYYMDHDQRL